MKLKIVSLFSKYSAEITSFFIFLLLIPLYSYINFYQNDDWNRNSTVLRFLSGDFSLLQVTATTFYSQGILGFMWAILFSPSKIPFLTLLISISNFYLFWKILQKLEISNDFTRFLISMILLTNPLHAYSSIGFMTENFVIFYILLGILFFLKNQFYLSAFFGMAAFFSKQNALIFLVGISLYFLLKNKYKELKIFSIFTSLSLFIYYFIFPRTLEMKDKDFNFINVTNIDYIFSLIYGILIYLVFFTLPILIYYIWDSLKVKSFKYISVIFLCSIGIFFLFNNFYKPSLISWEEFPYFENTFERTGFLPRTVDGTKYQFKYNYDLYFYTDLISKFFLSVFLTTFISKFFNFSKNKYMFIDYNFIIININLVLMIFVSIFFDRYVLLFLPFLILFLITGIKNFKFINITLIPYVIFQTYFSFFLTSDFIYTHNYIWSKANDLVNNQLVSPQKIDATGAWNRNYKISDPVYLFSYDSPKVNKNYKENYTLVEVKDINFKGNLFINPKIYLYKRN